MTDGWYDPAIDDPAPQDGGSFTAPVAIGVLHTTEGEYTPTPGSYFGHSSYPHFTVDVDGGTFRSYQHISIRRAARALRNPAGGVQTNRAGVVQIEVVGFAAQPFTSDPVLVQGLSALMRWIESETDIPPTSTVTWQRYPVPPGAPRVRLTAAQWQAYRGWLGHQHVPENDHGDPGAIDVQQLLPDPDPKELPSMILVQEPDGPRVFVCGPDTARHIGPDERDAYLEIGLVPFLNGETPAQRTRRAAMLTARGVAL